MKELWAQTAHCLIQYQWSRVDLAEVLRLDVHSSRKSYLNFPYPSCSMHWWVEWGTCERDQVLVGQMQYGLLPR